MSMRQRVYVGPRLPRHLRGTLSSSAMWSASRNCAMDEEVVVGRLAGEFQALVVPKQRSGRNLPGVREG